METGSGVERGRRVALLAPMTSELAPLVRVFGLTRSQATSPAGERLHVGRVGDTEVIACRAGIGTTAATEATERLLEPGDVHHVMVVGIAGAVDPVLAIGAVVVPEAVLDGASGATYVPSPFGGLPSRGLLLTTHEFVPDPAFYDAHRRHGVVAVDMETAAVAAVCERRGCSWSVVRAISDRVTDATVGTDVVALANPDGSANVRALARYVAARPWRIRHLARLGRDANRAARAAATTAHAAVHREGASAS